jgi:hypothetical protein
VYCPGGVLAGTVTDTVNDVEVTFEAALTVAPEILVFIDKPAWKLLPLTVTVLVWPITRGELTAVGLGPGSTVKHAVQVAGPLGVLTVVSTLPTCAVDVTYTETWSVFTLTNVTPWTLTPVLEKLTVDDELKPFPYIFMVGNDPPWPTAEGTTETTDGSGAAVTVRHPLQVPTPPSGLVTKRL